MRNKILYFILGSSFSIILFLLLMPTKEIPAVIQQEDRLIPEYVTNTQTGASARIMETDIIYFDTDNDGDEENVILYSCYGCNAPPRELAIIDDGELVLFIEGGNLSFTPTAPGVFTISEANVPRDGSRISTKYSYDAESKTYSQENIPD